ncbi:MAG: coproporphyrinogen III oxidase family protein [Acidobacteria bacterium]|nr:coproporphyrinogen III oxidase family protein [Acidobacteriota bacterium]MBI3423711.1 coproporphyrinogen III oxidase family protein [Acidobacteriota bacterium]
MQLETSQNKTEVGNYFVSNYPPFSQWKPENIPDALAALEQPARPDQPLGLYLHIPFCRKRCKFCYFKVYTDKNATEIEAYLNAVIKENEIYSRMPALQGRPLRLAYFGGGTPSYLSERQLHYLVEGLNRHVSWAQAEEVTFECEPGTLRKAKLETLKAIGVTRLSLGVEHFNDDILAANGRAHLSAEVYQAYEWARTVDFPQINIDLIAGMMGESEALWHETVRRALELEPDSVTIYQMELPYNTVISKDMIEKGLDSPIADWPTKRRWIDYAFEQFQARGYRAASAYTLATTKKPTRFIYTDNLWHGGDMIGLGVSSFSHFDGVHFQNAPRYEDYLRGLENGELPLWRALRLTPKQKLIREMILLLKTGALDTSYFRSKFNVDVWQEFQPVYEQLSRQNMLQRHNGQHERIELTRVGLQQIDHLLPEFFEPELKAVRYA